jgi:hypothetical protein
MEPTVFYADDNVDHEKLAREVFNYVPDSRTGEPPTPPSSYGFGPPRDSIEPSPSYPRVDSSGRDKIASYYHAIKHSPGVSTTVKSDVPSVLLGIQSALGLEGISTQSSPNNDIDNNYSPSHYPSYDQIVLLRKGLRKLIPILAKQSSSSPSSSFHSRLSVSSSSRVEDKIKPVDQPSLHTTGRSTSSTEPLKPPESSEEETALNSSTTYQS